MRTILLSRTDESYLQKCATEHKFAYGIIIGQHAEIDKDVVVHLAKNGEEEIDLVVAPQEDHTTQTISDIDTQALTNQWVSACKMIPGSFVVLGVFVSSVKADITDEKTFKVAKKILYDVHNLLAQGNYYCGSVNDTISHEDYLFLAYSTADKDCVCKSYTQSTNGGSFSDMECRFVERPFEWYLFECSYELDDIFPILDLAQKINIEHQFQHTIEAVKANLSASEIFIQNEMVDETCTLETYIKYKYGKKDKPQGAIRASIYLPVRCQMSTSKPIKVKEFNGTIRFSGVISSRIWCNPKNSLGDVKRFVRDDILRSLAARIQVYCDGLTETNVSNDAIFISEPPRRVYFHLNTGAVGAGAGGGGGASGGGTHDANTNTAIQFSEYIFRGEAPTVAVAQAKQILDLDISTESICADLEGLPEDETFSDTSFDLHSNGYSDQARQITACDLSRTMYMLGIFVALLVLIISIMLHYLFR